MTDKPKTPVKVFFAGIALLIGLSLVALLLWLAGLVFLAVIVFFVLTYCTDLSFGVRVIVSLFVAFGTLKILGLFLGVLDLFSEPWGDEKKKIKPCPECGKNLRTALAQQCVHCGADWHS